MHENEFEIIPTEAIRQRPPPTTSDPAPPPPARGAGRSRRWGLAVGVATAVALIVAVVVARSDSSPPIGDADKTTTSTEAPPPFPREVYASILPSIVYIQTEQPGVDGETLFGIGSGVIVNTDGLILTAHHVVADATVIRVVFFDATESDAVVISAEPDDDIAVIAADSSPAMIVPAVLAGTDRLRVGDEAYAVGNPLGLTASFSAGVISALDRSVPVDGGRSLDGLIQFDTAVNPGNSGGPLLDRRGQVIGIVTALANPTDQETFSGIGFAVPIAVATDAAGGPRV